MGAVLPWAVLPQDVTRLGVNQVRASLVEAIVATTMKITAINHHGGSIYVVIWLSK